MTNKTKNNDPYKTLNDRDVTNAYIRANFDLEAHRKKTKVGRWEAKLAVKQSICKPSVELTEGQIKNLKKCLDSTNKRIKVECSGYGATIKMKNEDTTWESDNQVINRLKKEEKKKVREERTKELERIEGEKIKQLEEICNQQVVKLE